MIVRLMGEGQFLVPADVIDDLNRLDQQLDADLESGQEETFYHHLARIHALVREQGVRIAIDELVPSDALVPPADTTLAELRALLGDDGLIPG